MKTDPQEKRKERRKKERKFFQEFKAFALRGNVIDLAVGVMIGTAFNGIISSLVNDIFMPVIGMMTGGYDISALAITLGQGENAAMIKYGAFLNAVLQFLLIAVFLFLVVKLVNTVHNRFIQHKKEEAVKEKPRLCPYCFMEVAKEATRCPHCTSILESDSGE